MVAGSGPVAIPLPDVDEGEAVSGGAVEASDLVGLVERASRLMEVFEGWPERASAAEHLERCRQVVGSLGWLDDPAAAEPKREVLLDALRRAYPGAVLAPDGTAAVLDSSLRRFTNGCAVTPDGSELWVIQSLGPDVSRIDLERGGPPETVVALPGTVPDGIAFTADGGAVISCYRPDRIYYLDPEGRLEVIAEDPEGTLLAGPTNICFLGDRHRLVSANLGRWHLTLLETDLTGVPPHAPEPWAVDLS